MGQACRTFINICGHINTFWIFQLLFIRYVRPDVLQLTSISSHKAWHQNLKTSTILFTAKEPWMWAWWLADHCCMTYNCRMPPPLAEQVQNLVRFILRGHLATLLGASRQTTTICRKLVCISWVKPRKTWNTSSYILSPGGPFNLFCRPVVPRCSISNVGGQFGQKWMARIAQEMWCKHFPFLSLL